MKAKSDTYYTDANASCLPPSRRRDSASQSNIQKKATRIKRGWPPERRAEQAARCRAQRLWRHSTGPKSVAGKARSAQNALKHGLRCAAYRRELTRLRENLRLHRAFLSRIKLEAKLLALSTSRPNHGIMWRDRR